MQQSINIVRLNDNAEVDRLCRTVLCDMTSEVFLNPIEVILRVFIRSERQHLQIPPPRMSRPVRDTAVRQRHASDLLFILIPS